MSITLSFLISISQLYLAWTKLFILTSDVKLQEALLKFCSSLPFLIRYKNKEMILLLTIGCDVKPIKLNLILSYLYLLKELICLKYIFEICSDSMHSSFFNSFKNKISSFPFLNIWFSKIRLLFCEAILHNVHFIWIFSFEDDAGT